MKQIWQKFTSFRNFCISLLGCVQFGKLRENFIILCQGIICYTFAYLIIDKYIFGF